MYDKYLTVVMPALNEEESIIQAIDATLEAFDEYNIDGEIIVVNDGSTDRTPKLVEDKISKNQNGLIRLINHAKPCGVGASFWDGVDLARGRVVTFLPGDNENKPGETMRYSSLLDHVDIVVPFVVNKDVRLPFRNFMSSTFLFIINMTFGTTFNYTNGSMLYKTSLLNELDYRADGFSFQTDILLRLVRRGYLFAEVPYMLGVRATGTSKAFLARSLQQVIRCYLCLIKDIYFSRKNRTARGRFHKDSQSARRCR